MMQWPPLIRVAQRERWRIWRDAIITIAAWGVFLIIFATQSVLFWQTIAEFQTEHPGAFLENWHFRLKPFGALVFILLIWLLLFGWYSLWNFRRVTHLPTPSSLPVAVESARRGMPVESIARARDLKVATLSIDDAGRFTST